MGGGLTLVLTWLKAGRGGGIHEVGAAKPKVLLLVNPLELQYYFAFFKGSEVKKKREEKSSLQKRKVSSDGR